MGLGHTREWTPTWTLMATVPSVTTPRRVCGDTTEFSARTERRADVVRVRALNLLRADRQSALCVYAVESRRAKEDNMGTSDNQLA